MRNATLSFGSHDGSGGNQALVASGKEPLFEFWPPWCVEENAAIIFPAKYRDGLPLNRERDTAHVHTIRQVKCSVKRQPRDQNLKCVRAQQPEINMALAKQNDILPLARQSMLPAIFFSCLFLSAAICVKAQDAKQSSPDESWTATKETTTTNTNPARTRESHTKSGDRTVDTQKFEVLGPDRRYQPFSETEAETIQVDSTTTRTVLRTYTWDGNGRRQLSRITEEQSRTAPNGDVHMDRKTSAADVNGSLQVIQREVADTRKISPNVEETKSTVSRPDSYGGFSQTEQMQELKTRNADDSVESKTKRLVPDGNGNWGVLEVKEKTIKDDGKKRTTEERVLRPDSEGRLSESSRIVSKETDSGTGEKRKTVETYSDYVPGYRYSGMHLNQRVTIIRKRDSGAEVIEEQVEQPSAGNPSDSPKATEKTKYVVKYGYAGTQQTKTVEARDGGGNFHVVSVETQKSEGATFPQNPPTPADKYR